MKKILLLIAVITTIVILLLGTKQEEITPTVIKYEENINKINEICHVNTNKLNIDLNIEYLNTVNDKKIILYGNEIDELNNYLDKNYYIENKILNITLKEEGYVYEIFSVFISKEDDYNHTQLVFIDNEYENHINYLINESIYEKENINKDSYIITIQKQLELNKYLIINARRL